MALYLGSTQISQNAVADKNDWPYWMNDGGTHIWYYIPPEAECQLSDANAKATLYIKYKSTDQITIDWGDGSSKLTYAASPSSYTGRNLEHNFIRTGWIRVDLYGPTEVTQNAGYGMICGCNGVGQAANATNHWLKAIEVTNFINNPSGINGSVLARTCAGLEYVKFNNPMIENLPTYFMSECWNLKKIELPSSIKSLTTSSFAQAYSLRELTLPDSITEFKGVDVFRNPYQLRKLKLSSNLTNITNNAFRYCCMLDDIYIPDSVTTMGNECFRDCHSVRTIRLSPNCATIPQSAFYLCYALKELDVPEGVTTIGTQAFMLCGNLNKITLPSTLTSIGARAFDQQGNRKPYPTIVTINATTPPTLASTYIFDNATTRGMMPPGSKIYVPKGTLSTYQTATNWSAFASFMEEQSDDLKNMVRVNITDDYRDFHFSEGIFKYNGTKTEAGVFLADGHSSFTVDWGDGSPIETYTADTKDTCHHEYAENGVYEILISDDIKCFCFTDNVNLLGVRTASLNTMAPFYWWRKHGSYVRFFYGCSDLRFANLSNAPIAESPIFYKCSKLKTVMLTGVTTVREGAFYDCTDLTGFTLPSVTTINNQAFEYAAGTFTFGGSLTTIGEYSFYKSTANLHFTSTIPPTITATTFGEFKGTIKVPSSALAAYKAADNWSTIADSILGE